ncbi:MULTISPECIES: hypothetical protein [unclassified Bosea (in: a-proteobacteria)]|uniref:hypothetical protein n=1 Tax=unclassified Bosea (in: a-proteobacteria) TaxID=2653178 RepID=UPI000F75220B|nr:MULTISPECIES: hypothetical protein [unclassified Bosea (in: a-proteobacteria)]AZO76587.1 hypothetical protein BLM15_02430 [Bosea sp. Tri-49]RXT21420.1 hypothetical protein B5U98_13045 [Bosea sp. Tri-39]RXT31759.1 hypothetical protein B5U99_23890 [Bosea sp. Tri-54]
MHKSLIRLLLIPLDLVVGLVILLDELLRPLYRPLIARFASLRLVARLETAIGRLPPYGALIALAIPFAIVEPLKLLGLLFLARGAFTAGIVTTAIGHLAGFLLVERVYHAGRAQLLTIPWFARIMGWIDAIRQVVIGRIKASTAWQRAVVLVRLVRERLRGLRLWFARRRA